MGGPAIAERDEKLVALLADAHRWIEDLMKGRASSVRDLARQNHCDVGEVSRTLPLAFLAPDLVEAILAGRQPVHLTPRQFKRIGTLPIAGRISGDESFPPLECKFKSGARNSLNRTAIHHST